MPLLTTGAGVFPAPVVAGGTTWDNTNKASIISLDGTKLIATNTSGGAWGGARSVASSAAAKIYFEATVGGGGVHNFVGLCDSAYIPSAQGFPGQSAGFAMGFDGVVYGGASVTVGGGSAFANGDKVCVAFDASSRKAWFRVGSAGNWNNDVIGNQNPVGGIGGYSFSSYVSGAVYAVFATLTLNGTMTANFTNMANAPSGYGAL